MHGKLKVLFPKSYTYYVEPFGGSFSVGLSQDHAGVNEIYNDLEENVYSLYKVIADKDLFEQLRFKLEISPYSEQMRKDSVEALKGELSLVDRAFHFFYVARTSRQGTGAFAVNPLVRRGMGKSVSSYLGAVDRLPELHQRMSKVAILNRNAIDLIQDYSKPEAFLMMDPPYEHSTRGATRYKVDMDRDIQIKFLEAVKDNKAQCMICGYDNDLYNEMLGDRWHRTDFTVNNSDAGGNMRTKVESVWRNYGKTDDDIF